MDDRRPGPDVEAGPPQTRKWRAGIPRWLLVSVAVAVLLGVAGAWSYFSGRESTDDAQIDGHVNPVAARVGGIVQEVLVHDNEHVEKGALLARIDPRDLEVAVARARADLAENEASARAAHTSVPLTSTTSSAQERAAESELAGAQARLAAARAALDEAEARARQTRQDAERLDPLLARDEVSKQQHDTAATAADAAVAARDAAAAQVNAAEKATEAARAHLAQARTGRDQVGIASARAESATAKVAMAQAVLDQANLNLSYSEVRAPVSGVVSRKAVEVGQVVQPGQPLLAIVPLDDIWVTANFKESQLENIRPGQRVVVSVDAYGGRKYRGRVDSIAAATGARFSLLPPENATGNFVKVVQRVPVKIRFDEGQDREHLLRPGMSVVPTVLTR
jgi:membrane fusion protein (multidrug efflux system)